MPPTPTPGSPREDADADVFRRSPYLRNNPDALHAEGARRFGLRWLHATRTVIRIAGNYGLDKSLHVGLLTEMAWEICLAETEVRA